jgi:hypothetical protein
MRYTIIVDLVFSISQLSFNDSLKLNKDEKIAHVFNYIFI